MASPKEELGQQIVSALTDKVEKRFRRESRGGDAEAAGLVLQNLTQALSTELIGQEAHHRDAGQPEIADTFLMVREKMLPTVIREVYAKVA